MLVGNFCQSLLDRLHKGAPVPTPKNLPPSAVRAPEAGNFRKLEKAVAVSLTLAVVARVVICTNGGEQKMVMNPGIQA
jgi:hypothetical protein